MKWNTDETDILGQDGWVIEFLQQIHSQFDLSVHRLIEHLQYLIFPEHSGNDRLAMDEA